MSVIGIETGIGLESEMRSRPYSGTGVDIENRTVIAFKNNSERDKSRYTERSRIAKAFTIVPESESRAVLQLEFTIRPFATTSEVMHSMSVREKPRAEG
ncbi:hypothetical protein EVAR_54357_1 [Eumeta japonica]|uniref:Uncharacterized protein n=1 Tax=Eumeta variegata TaxID=151549 RepID=A0A4C1Z6M4_EUMVA|nr:hypothetical protein EVAR_54357_1 [Eumeta japonica]